MLQPVIYKLEPKKSQWQRFGPSPRPETRKADNGLSSELSAGFPGVADGKESDCQCRRQKECRFNPWVRRISWRRIGNPLQYSYLKNPTDRRAWRTARVRQGGHKSDMTEPLNTHTQAECRRKPMSQLENRQRGKFSLLPSSSPFETLNGFDGGHPH